MQKQIPATNVIYGLMKLTALSGLERRSFHVLTYSRD